ncbi:MAG: hypothetical protein R6U36_02285 [Candidatus Fermentibacteraceae bacterium]
MQPMGASSPEEAASGAWNALVDGDRAAFLQTLAPGETERLTEACRSFRDRVAAMPAQRQSALFSHLLLEAAPGEVSRWMPLDMLELLTGTTTSRRAVEELDPEFTAPDMLSDTCEVRISLDPDSFSVKAVNLGGSWLLTGTDELLREILLILPEPWPQPQ